MSPVEKGIDPRQRERFAGLLERLKAASATLEGQHGVSVYDRPELQPGYEQLQRHLDRALLWAEEIQWIIEREFSGRQT